MLVDALLLQLSNIFEVQVIQEMPGPQRTLWIQSLFLFSLSWSVGGNTDGPGRAQFNTYLRQLVDNNVPEELSLFMDGKRVQINQMIPSSGTVYDYMFDKSKSKWENWLQTIEPKPLSLEAEYSTIVVPTVDTLRCVSALHSALLGPTVRQVCILENNVLLLLVTIPDFALFHRCVIWTFGCICILLLVRYPSTDSVSCNQNIGCLPQVSEALEMTSAAGTNSF
jgi:Dynein heavy chain AAA lid domain